MQSKVESLKETTTNIIIGYLTALVSQLLIFPLFSIEVTIFDNLLIGFYFTLISFLRSYLVRRYYNSKSRNKNNKNKTKEKI